MAGSRRYPVIPGRAEGANPESRNNLRAGPLDSGSGPAGRPGMTAFIVLAL